jgi:hypothetical protein
MHALSGAIKGGTRAVDWSEGQKRQVKQPKSKWSSKKRSSCRGVYQRTVVASKGSELRGERMITLYLRCVFARLWRVVLVQAPGKWSLRVGSLDLAAEME